MSYRWQETMKILIPGFYILSCVGVGCLLTHCDIMENVCEYIGKIAAISIVVMLLAAFMIGYINEIISGGIEYILYCLGISRPSRLVLNNTFERFSIVKNRELRQRLQIPENGKVNNAKSAKCLAQAKQTTEIEKYQEFYYQSILARNLFFGHIFSSVLLIYAIGWSWVLFFVALIVAALLCWQWWKMNLVYIKKVFVEYLK